MVPQLSIKIIRTKKDLEKALRIRRKVFVEEQGAPVELEQVFDSEAIHFLISYNKKPVGTCRVRFIGKKAKLERLAVLKKYRRKGLGKLGLNHMISYAKRKRAKQIYLHGQHRLKKYYESLGFIAKGKTFMEGPYKHIKMYYDENE